jgi:hypothetical protein
MCRFCIRKSKQKKPDQTSGLLWCYFVLAGAGSAARAHMGVATGNAHGIRFRVVQMKYRAFLDTVSLKYSFS